MFAGTLTKNADTAAAIFTGMIHSTKFDIAIQLGNPPEDVRAQPRLRRHRRQ